MIWQVITEMKTKYLKEKQIDSSALLSILAMLNSLALSPNHGRSATPAGQAHVSGVMLMSHNFNTRSMYMDVTIFLAQKKSHYIISLFLLSFYLL